MQKGRILIGLALMGRGRLSHFEDRNRMIQKGLDETAMGVIVSKGPRNGKAVGNDVRWQKLY